MLTTYQPYLGLNWLAWLLSRFAFIRRLGGCRIGLKPNLLLPQKNGDSFHFIRGKPRQSIFAPESIYMACHNLLDSGSNKLGLKGNLINIWRHSFTMNNGRARNSHQNGILSSPKPFL